MELILFVVFLALSVILIALGLYRQEHSELPLAGFLFLFLLSFTLIGNNLQYQTGQTETVTFDYNASGTLIQENHTFQNTYAYYDDTTSDFNTHRVGYWLAVVSFIGFVGVLLGLRKSRGYE